MGQEGNNANWWDTWDETLLNTNINWFQTVSKATNLPFIIWQANIGTDFHLLGNNDNKSMIEKFANANIIGVLFELQNYINTSNPDDFRAHGDFGIIPPENSAAGGTAMDLRQRLTLYSKDPYVLPTTLGCDTTNFNSLITTLNILTNNNKNNTDLKKKQFMKNMNF